VCLQAIGSSAAESSTMSSFDAALGITHGKGEATYIRHADFIDEL